MESQIFKNLLGKVSIFFVFVIFLLTTSRELTKITFLPHQEEGMLKELKQDSVDYFLRKNYGFGLSLKNSMTNAEIGCNQGHSPSTIEISALLRVLILCEGIYNGTETQILAFNSAKKTSDLTTEIAGIQKNNSDNGFSLECLPDKEFQLDKKMPGYILDCIRINETSRSFVSILIIYPIKVFGVGNAVITSGYSQDKVKGNLRELSKEIIYLSQLSLNKEAY